jgi:hypothetical protein
MRVSIRLGVSLLVLLVGALPAAAQTGTTAIYFDSQPGDDIGEGLQRTWTGAELTFSVSVSADRSRVTVYAVAPSFGWLNNWSLTFAGPESAPLVPGAYDQATRYPFHVKSLNGLDVSGSGRGCGSSAGRFRIHEIVIDDSGVVQRFAADFEQHCDRRTPALFGAVRYRSTRGSLVPFDGAYPVYAIRVDDAVNGYVTGPGIDCGAGRTDCDETFGAPSTIALTAIPNPGYVFLGWAGFDCVGVETVTVAVNWGRFCRPVFNASPGGPGIESPNYATNAAFLDGVFGSWDLTPAGVRSRVAAVRPYGQVTVHSADPTSVYFLIDHTVISSASVRFSAGAGQSLAPGLFQPVAGSRFGAVVPSVEFTYRNSACGDSGGRLRIYEIAFDGPTLAAFSADFEVPCHDRIVTGSIRYNAARASLLPFDGVYPSSGLRGIPPTTVDRPIASDCVPRLPVLRLGRSLHW